MMIYSFSDFEVFSIDSMFDRWFWRISHLCRLFSIAHTIVYLKSLLSQNPLLIHFTYTHINTIHNWFPKKAHNLNFNFNFIR